MDRTVGDLRYGTVGINEWVIVSFLFGYLPWGAFPGHTPTAIGSGTGHVLNALMLADPQKTVITRSFRPRIRPLTSVANRSAGATTRRLLAYSASDDLRRLPAVMASALRG